MHFRLDTKIFNKIYLPYLEDETRLQVFFGGSASGKSKFIAQRVIYDLLRGGRNYLIVRQNATTSKVSTFPEIRKVISEWNVEKHFKVNLSDLVITCKLNGFQILFKGLDNPEKLKSITPNKGVLTDLWLEEATEISITAYKQLRKRLRGQTHVKKRITLSFNPILKTHWIFTELFKNFYDKSKEVKLKDKTILKTTYKDNRFLTVDDVEELENETDRYHYDVYTLGNWGTLGDVIFRNWEVKQITNKEKNQFDNYRNGIDFGYSNDPFAFVRSHYDKKHKTIYIIKEFYQKKLTNDQVASAVKPIIEKEYVTCDSAEPKSIKELQNLGISALSAKKGKDSILHGIQWLQQQKIIVDPSCPNMVNEFQVYSWKEDKQGVALRIPVDKSNHLIDALRYAYSLDMNYATIKMVKIKGF